MSMTIQQDEVQAIVALISEERLNALLELTGSPVDAITLHQDTLSLGASLMNITATIEIALRNTVCNNLEEYFSPESWLDYASLPFQWRHREKNNIGDAFKNARRAKYKKLSQDDKAALDLLAFPNGRPDGLSHRDRVMFRQKKIPVSDGSVIAELNLSFWKRLYAPDYDQALWRTTLKRTFPNKALRRPQIADQLEIIYQSRNRLAHHEPVLHKRYRDTISAIQFIVENMCFADKNPTSPLANLIADDMAKITVKADELHMKLDSYRA